MKKKTEHQLAFLRLLIDLLTNGFSFQEALVFIERTNAVSQRWLVILQQNFADGDPFSQSLSQLGFTAQQIVQVQLAEQHGNIPLALENIHRQVLLLQKQKQNIEKLISYPIVLFLFLIGAVTGLRFYMLPQLLASETINESDLFVQLLLHSPWIIAAVLTSVAGSYGSVRWLLGKKSALQRAAFWAKCPLVGTSYRLFVSGYFSLEWGKLFQEGLELQQIIESLRHTDKQSLMYALSVELNHTLQEGRSLIQKLQQYPFLSKEFELIIRQGEVKGKLGEELLIYSDWVWRRFFLTLEKKVRFIQPISFLVVAVLIVVIYASMLAPMYSNIERLV